MDILRMIVTVVYVIAAIAIIAVVLLQEGKSAGLSGLTGGSNQDTYYAKNKKHTLEGKFERWTKITAATFIILAIVLMVL